MVLSRCTDPCTGFYADILHTKDVNDVRNYRLGTAVILSKS